MLHAAAFDESFAVLLGRLRRAGGLTQEQLAHRSGLSVRAISSLECGVRRPRRFTVDRLAEALALSDADRRGLLAAAGRHGRGSPPHAGAPGLTPAGSPPGAIVGRAAELGELRTHLTGAGPALLAYEGEPGIGKTRLLAEAVRLATRGGVPVLAGAARPGGGAYAPIVDALAEYVRRTPARALTEQLRGCVGLDLLLPELADRLPAVSGPPHQHRRLMFEAAARFVDNIAAFGVTAGVTAAGPLLALDDLQWAGRSTADLLTHLVCSCWPRPRVVVAYRAGEVAASSALAQRAADLARLGLLASRRLAPLPAADATALVASVVAADPTATVDHALTGRIVRRAGGLPLFLTELTRHALAVGSAGGGVPEHLRLVATQQLMALPSPVVAVLRRMAVAGVWVTPEQLVDAARPAQLTPDLVLDCLETACRYRLLKETRRGFRFRYPLMREVVAAGLGPNRRRLWRAARAS